MYHNIYTTLCIPQYSTHIRIDAMLVVIPRPTKQSNLSVGGWGEGVRGKKIGRQSQGDVH